VFVRRAVLVGLVAALLGSAIFVAPVRAQTAVSITFDGGGDYPYELWQPGANTQSIWTGGYVGDALISTTTTVSGGCGTPAQDAFVGIEFDWTPSNIITEIDLWAYMSSTMAGTYSTQIYAYIDSSWTEVADWGGGIHLPTAYYDHWTVPLDVEGATAIRIRTGACWGESLQARLDEITITYGVGPTATPTPTSTPEPSGWAYPVAVRDRPSDYPSLYPRLSPFAAADVSNLPDDEPAPLLGITNQPYQAVHAMVDGVITAISPLGDNCINQGAFGGVVGKPVQWSCLVYDPENDGDVLHVFYLPTPNAYLIEQTAGDERVYYIVQEVKVEVGNAISRDCILGLTLPFKWGYPVVSDSTYGWTMVFGLDVDDDPFDLTPRLSHEPDDISCNTDGWVYTVGTITRSVTRPHIYRVLPPFAELDKPDRSASLFISSYAGSDVHAAVDGEITAVDPLGGICINTMGLINSPGTCTVNDIADLLPLDYLHHLIWANAYVVTQDVGDGRTLKYVLTNPRVAVGDEVSASCILGQTGTMQRSDYSVVTNSAEGWALVQGLDDGDAAFDVAPLMAVEPQAMVCRGLEGVACALVRDPGFDENFSVWQADTSDPSHFADGLIPEGRTWQSDLYLDPATEYAILIRHRPEVGANAYSFNVTLGTEDPHPITYFPKDGNSPKDVIIPAQTYTANSTGTYTLSIEEILNPLDARVDFICIYDPEGDGEIPQPGGGCLLLNHEFDQDGTYWTPTGVTVFGGGLARVLDEGAIAQALKLSPKSTGPQDYVLTVKARRAGVYAAGETIDLGWTWGGTFSGTLSGFTTTTGSNFQEKSATFTVSGAATNDLTLTVDADNSSAKSLHIDSVCINTADGVVPPGYLPPPVIEANCRICVYEPSGDIAQDMSELVGWLGCMLLSLWECSVKSVLVGIWTVLTNILMMIGYVRMWLSLIFANFAEWANGSAVVFANYLGSELWNLGTRIQNTLTSLVSVTQIQTGSAGIWDVFLALINQLGSTIGNVIYGVLSPLIDLIRDFIGGIFSLVGAVVNLISALLSLVIGLITGVLTTLLGTALGIVQAIINGINMTPTAPMPNWLISCGDPLSGAFTPDNQLGYLCLGIWMMEQKFRSGPAQYFLPIFIGLASLALLMWGVQRILNTIANLADGGSSE